MSDASAKTAPDYRRILLTGGTGFVGGYLAPRLAEAWPAAERVMLRRPGETTARSGWSVVQAELTDGAAIEQCIARIKPDLILHLAAQSEIGAGASYAEAAWRINFGGTFELAAASARHCPDLTFFFVSSAQVYGESFRDGVASEETQLRPMNAYAHAKAAAESMLPDVLPKARLLVARPFNHTGPGQDQRFVLPSLAAQIAEIEAGLRPARLQMGNLAPQRDFLDVRDVCEAYLAILRTPQDGPRRLLYNVSSGQSYRIGDLVEKFRAHARRPFEVIVDESRVRKNDIMRAAGSSERLAAATGWRPKASIDDIIAGLLDHWRKAGATGAA